MKKLLLSVLTLITLSLSAFAQEKPNVLIIGDSISVGYTPFVKEGLKDIANVERVNGNAQATKNALEKQKDGKTKVEGYIAGKKFDLIHFNWGLHDLCYRNPEVKNVGNRDKINGAKVLTIEEYEENLQTIIDILNTTNAKLIFATTTYVPEGEVGRHPQDAQKYNEVALRVMKKNNITVNPLYDISEENHKKYGNGDTKYGAKVGDVHYKKEGYAIFAKQVNEYIRKALTEK
ncbi:MAG: SGNH/GDSL hydrolase family protein [Opitutales bacterium]